MLRSVSHTFVFIVFLFLLVAGVSPADDQLMQLLTKLKTYHQYRPQQKIYLHLDKPLYAAGEDIWFSAYLVDAALHTPDSLSRIVYVELRSPEKELLQHHILYSPNGITHSDFHLPDSLPQGNYVIRAYTNYMKNIDEDFFFTKEIPVLSINTSTKVPPVIENTMPDIQFFPEGGNLLNGVENFVAFKAVNQFGTGIDITGEIIDDQDKVITSFATEHQGMGSFKLPPGTSEHYRARIKNTVALLNLPEITDKGYLLRVLDMGTHVKVIAYSNLKSYSAEPCLINVIAQCGGIVSFAAHGEILKTAMAINIPKSKLPSGITQITLFDGNGVPQCERLIFVNHQNTLNVKVMADRKTYSKRQPVSLEIDVRTKDNKPASGYFSLSVYDESKIKDPETYPLSIDSYLLLTSDLKGRVEEPGYYFKDTLALTKHHLDLLMLTNGWRRFTWKKVLDDTLTPLSYYAEHGIVVSGKLQKIIFSNKPAKDSKIKIMTEAGDLAVLKTDSLGRFYSDALLYYDSTKFIIQTDNAKGKQSDLKFTLDPFPVSPALNSVAVPLGATEALLFMEQTQAITKINQAYKNETSATLLKEVEVKAKKIEPDNPSKIYGAADNTIAMKDMPATYTSIFQVLQGRVAGLMASDNPPSVSIRGGGTPLFLLNGMQIEIDFVSSIPVNDIESIDILKGASAAIYGGRGGNGVIAIYTKKGVSISRPSVGIHLIRYPGLYKAREFYTPRHDNPGTEQAIPDIRNTLYWNPAAKPTPDGKVLVTFFTSDVDSHYKISIEGISTDGIPGVATSDFSVE